MLLHRSLFEARWPPKFSHASQPATCSLPQQLMCEARIRRAPVVDGSGHIQGIISLIDIARTAGAMWDSEAAEFYQTEVGRTLAAIGEPRVQKKEPIPPAA